MSGAALPRRLRRAALALLLGSAASLAAAAPPAAGAEDSPHAFVRQNLDRLLEILEREGLSERELEAELASRIRPLIHERFLVAQVMGAGNYKKATKEQRKRFADRFLQGLLGTYARSVLEFEFQKVEVVPAGSPVKGKRAQVRMLVTTATQDVDLVYDMYRTSGGWKLINLRVAGADVVSIFRNQFAAALVDAKGDLGKVIDEWEIGGAARQANRN